MLTRYALRHRNKLGMIKQVVAPPCLSEWTADMDEAQLFEIEAEASDCARYISETAFSVEVFTLYVTPSDPRIQSEQCPCSVTAARQIYNLHSPRLGRRDGFDSLRGHHTRTATKARCVMSCNVMYLGMADDILLPLLIAPELDNLFVISRFDAAYSPDATAWGQRADIRQTLELGHNGSSQHIKLVRKYRGEEVTRLPLGLCQILHDVFRGGEWNLSFQYGPITVRMLYQYRDFVSVWDSRMRNIDHVICVGATTPVFEEPLNRMLRERCTTNAYFYDEYNWGQGKPIRMGSFQRSVYVHKLATVLAGEKYPPGYPV